MEESETRRLALLPTRASQNDDPLSSGMPLVDVFTLHGRRSASSDPADERAFFLDVLAEYQWARDAAGLMPGTIDKLVKPVIELRDHYATVPWRIEPKHLDRYFAGVGKRARSTVRAKITNIDGFYAFLEQRYAGEISRLFGAAVESPVDPFNRPRHRGDWVFYAPLAPPSRAKMRYARSTPGGASVSASLAANAATGDTRPRSPPSSPCCPGRSPPRSRYG
ncbi:hypothetical protein [Streptomyces massasporeus]|uniref:hypothetical protein n=1 Tax=Streptomyces massasporeus TaxID=67324 RepID=UPI003702E768